MNINTCKEFVINGDTGEKTLVLNINKLNDLLIEILKEKLTFYESGVDSLKYDYNKLSNDEIYNILEEKQNIIEQAIYEYKND